MAGMWSKRRTKTLSVPSSSSRNTTLGSLSSYQEMAPQQADHKACTTAVNPSQLNEDAAMDAHGDAATSLIEQHTQRRRSFRLQEAKSQVLRPSTRRAVQSSSSIANPATGCVHQTFSYTGTSSYQRARGSRAMEVGMLGELLALEYLQSEEGRSRFDVVSGLRECSRKHLGWDIDFTNSNGELIAVEVKAKVGRSVSSFVMTWHEMQMAEELRERYHILLIVDCEGSPCFQVITDPTKHFEREVNTWEVRLPL